MTALALAVLAITLGGALYRARRRLRRPVVLAGWGGVAALLVLALGVSAGAYELRKIVSYCLMPTGLVWLGLLGLAWSLWRARHSRGAAAVLGLWVVYTVAGNAWLGGLMIGRLQRGYDVPGQASGEPFEAVLVLGGGIDAGDDGRPRLTEGGDRVVAAVRLFRAGSAEMLVTSGPSELLPDGRLTSVPELTAAVWQELGIPRESIVKVVGPRTTSEEVLALKRLVAERGWRRVGLLTSAWHMPRALRQCRRHGVEVTPLPADVHGRGRLRLRSLVPQWLGFREVQVACWELLGMLAGR